MNAISVRKLFRWKQEAEDSKWASVAEAKLRKKIRGRPGAEDDFDYALSNPGQPSNCVTVSRSLDGRWQILCKKSLPHVVSCRLWRWEDLQNHQELISLDECKFPYSIKQLEVCVNPYHYRRVGQPILPPVLVPPRSEYPPESFIKIPVDPLMSSVPRNVSYTPNGFVHSQRHNNVSPQGYLVDYNALNYHTTTSPAAMTGYSPYENQSFTPVYYQEPKHWSTISYFELNHKVGESFRASISSIQVDGYSDPCNKKERFCLGVLQNINRNKNVEKIRTLIGEGVKLSYVEGNLYVECISAYPVFLQSHWLSRHYEFYPLTVCKIMPGCSLKVFNNLDFAQMLAECANQGHAAVSELTKFCTITLSFARGWGVDYNRKEVSSTPCWIQMHLHGPLQWHDRVLYQIGPADGNPTSFT